MLAHLKRKKKDWDRENEKKKLHLSLVNFEFLLLLECAVQLLTADNRENVSLLRLRSLKKFCERCLKIRYVSYQNWEVLCVVKMLWLTVQIFRKLGKPSREEAPWSFLIEFEMRKIPAWKMWTYVCPVHKNDKAKTKVIRIYQLFGLIIWRRP